MSEWYDKIVRHVQHTPPSCLSGFVCKPSITVEWADWVAWSVACPCGGAHGRVLGYPLGDFDPQYRGADLFVSPIGFRCATCERVTEIIDTREHGYNAEISKRAGQSWDSNYHGQGDPVIVPCPQCRADVFAVTAHCAHPNFDLIEDEPELEPRAQDFFDAFAPLGRCVACGTESGLTNFELA